MSSHGVNGGRSRPQMRFGIVGVGRVGSTLGVGVTELGHMVSAVTVASERSARIAGDCFPEARQVALAELPQHCSVIVLAVPDQHLQSVVQELAESGALRSHHFVFHVAGSRGTQVLAPLAAVGALVAAVHPAMTFPDAPTAVGALAGVSWAVTASDPRAQAVAEYLVLQLGGTPVLIDEELRVLYHAALTHGANHLVTLIADAQDLLEDVLQDSARSGVTSDGVDVSAYTAAGEQPLSREAARSQAAAFLRPLVTAALVGALERGDAALTGPAARGDRETVSAHELAIAAGHPDIAAFYAAAAEQTTNRADARSYR